MSELDDIAERISVAFTLLEEEVLELPTEEELLAFEKHLRAQDRAGPILRPEIFKSGLMREAIFACQDRIKIIRDIRKHIKQTEDIFKRDEIETTN